MFQTYTAFPFVLTLPFAKARLAFGWLACVTRKKKSCTFCLGPALVHVAPVAPITPVVLVKSSGGMGEVFSATAKWFVEFTSSLKKVY